MELINKYVVPTGEIFTGVDNAGKNFECLHVRDYGKSANIKADFLGLTENIQVVEHQEMLDIREKAVVTISTQSGCSMGCVFCDVPKVGKGANLDLDTLHFQVDHMIKESLGEDSGQRLNLHYARMGEGSWNVHVLEHAKELLPKYKERFDTVHPVVSTMMPRKNKKLREYLYEWMDIKNSLYNGEAGLQISVNSTNDEERELMFSGSSLTFDEVGEMVSEVVQSSGVVGRKVTLNFALAGYEIDEEKLLNYFDPSKFLCKLTPMHVTESVVDNEVSFIQPYEEVEKRLKSVGYDVIVFIPSKEEDEGRITCGNALLSGSTPEVRYDKVLLNNK